MNQKTNKTKIMYETSESISYYDNIQSIPEDELQSIINLINSDPVNHKLYYLLDISDSFK